MTNTITINYLETHLQKWKQERPGSFKACCPAHEDKEPSLSIKEGDGGRILLYCHAGCSYEQIISALGQPTAVNGTSPKPVAIKQRPQQKKRLVATYTYTDETGAALFQKCRYEPKTFMIRRPAGNNKWTWGIGEARRVLYHLPDFAKEDQTIFICEGEKDADRLAALGLVATTNFDGAGKWLNDEYNPHFTGRAVVILADNDDAGRNHAGMVANALAAGIAKSVKIIELPNLPEHGDVSDWLDAGGDLDQLLQIIEKTDRHVVKPDIDIRTPKTKDFFAAYAALGYEFRLNLLDDTIEVNGAAMTAGVEAQLRNKMRDWGLTSTGRILDAYTELAYQNRYNPIQEYLDGLKWNGNDILTQLNSYLHETTGFGPIALRRWLVGAVAKVYQHAQNYMLVIDGPQGIGKSRFTRWLCPLPTYYNEGPIKPDDKDYVLRMATKMIWEVAELQSTTRKADREALKAVLTMENVTLRKAYGKYDITKPAMVSFLGTINEDGAGFLTDSTGNRRYVIIRVESFNWDYEKELDVTQLWAQIVHLYKNGERWELSDEEAKIRDAINEEYQMNSVVAVYLFEHFEVDPRQTNLYTTSHEIMTTLRNDGLTGSSPAILAEVSRLLKQAGAKQFRARATDGRPTAYRGVFLRKLTERGDPNQGGGDPG